MTDTTNYDMNNEQPSKMKSALNFGAIMGLVFLAINFCSYLFELGNNKVFSFTTMALLAGAIGYGIKKYRDDQCGGFISYGQALGYGVLITLFCGIISSFGSYVYLSFIDDSFIQTTLEQTEIDMIEKGQSEEVIEMAMSMTRLVMSPIGIFFSGILATTFMGFIVSLIAAAFLKNDPDSFENA
ncbi:MAG: hypothetical protein ACJAV5_000431 [Vicingaceae bacterium]|jgi:hypothetical protein